MHSRQALTRKDIRLRVVLVHSSCSERGNFTPKKVAMVTNYAKANQVGCIVA